MKTTKHKLNYIALASVLLLGACNLDINENPNAPVGTNISPTVMLPAIQNRLVTTQVYTDYMGGVAAFVMGMKVPGDGLSGFGNDYAYTYTSGSYTDIWNRPMEDLRNLYTIVRRAASEPSFAGFSAIAKVLIGYEFLLLVDAYGDVPYTEGIRGLEAIYAPKFDKDADVYQAVYDDLNEAIIELKAAKNATGLVTIGNSDAMFGGDYDKWIKFANNVKLRILIHSRGSSIDSWASGNYSDFADGFLLEDVLVQPGYNASNNQNPIWSAYLSSTTGTQPQTSTYYIPSTFIASFYNGTKIKDDMRGALTYRTFPEIPNYQLGNEINRPKSPTMMWYVGTGTSKTAQTAKGICKSRSAAAPLFLAAETYFLLAEAALYGHELLPKDADAKSCFNNGILASFKYLSIEGTASAPDASINFTDSLAKYIADNPNNPLVDFDAATTVEAKLEAIITQKYISLNILTPFETFTEFRRTGYPSSDPTGVNPVTSLVSTQSQSTHPSRMCIRLIYPQLESDLNGSNTPKIANCFSSPIFFQKQ